MSKIRDDEVPQYVVLDDAVVVRVGKKRCVIFDDQPFLRVTLRDNTITYDSTLKKAYVNGNLELDRGKLQYHRSDDMRDEDIVHLNGEARDCRVDNLCYKSQSAGRKAVHSSQDFLALERRALELWSK
jgi:hypothetical protein